MGIEEIKTPDNNIDNVESKEVGNKLPDEVKDKLLSDVKKIDKNVEDASFKIGLMLKTVGLDKEGLSKIEEAFGVHDNYLNKISEKISKGGVDNSNSKETQDDLTDLKLFIGQTINALGNTTKADDNVYVGGLDRRGGLTQHSASSIAEMIKKRDVSGLKHYNDNGDTEMSDSVDNTEEYEEYVEGNEENEVETDYPEFSELSVFAKKSINLMQMSGSGSSMSMSQEDYYNKYKDSGKFDEYINDTGKDVEKIAKASKGIMDFFK